VNGLLRLLQLLAMVVWVGGLIFFAFILAPVAFHTLPTVREAGMVVGSSLRVFDVVCLACGAIFLFATALLFRDTPMRVRGRYELEFLLAAVMLIATAYIHFGILPPMEKDRSLAGGDINSVEVSNPVRVHFDKLHLRSERVEGAVLLIGLAVIFLMSREPVRVD
jgi:small-conductance mechanosensitive channel